MLILTMYLKKVKNFRKVFKYKYKYKYFSFLKVKYKYFEKSI